MRTKDITNKIINTSIDFKFNYNDENFYTTFYSLNKLLYFAQKQMIKKWIAISVLIIIFVIVVFWIFQDLRR